MRVKRSSPSARVRVVDVAHPPLPQGAVEELLFQIWMEARNTPDVRVIKVIHGYGSSGRGGMTQQVVRNWASKMRSKFRSVIDGERYSLYDPASQEMRRELGGFDDSELDAGNQGITYLWLR